MTQDKCKYGVFTKNREFAIRLINSMIDHKDVYSEIPHQSKKIYKVINRENSYCVFMENGDLYKWIKPNNNSRGNKIDVGIIDLATCNLDYISEWIPCICRKESNDKYIFVDSKINKDNRTYYDLRTLVDRLKKIEVLCGNLNEIGLYDISVWECMTNYMYFNMTKNLVSFKNHCDETMIS